MQASSKKTTAGDASRTTSSRACICGDDGLGCPDCVSSGVGIVVGGLPVCVKIQATVLVKVNMKLQKYAELGPEGY